MMMLVINTTLAAQGLMLKTDSVIDATLIDAPSSTKNQVGNRGPEMHQVKKGNQWHFGMKARIAVDADSGYRGIEKRVVAREADINWKLP